MKYVLAIVLLIFIEFTNGAVHPNPKCFFKKENFEFECFPGLMDKVKNDKKFKDAIDVCIAECKGEDKVKDIPDFPSCNGHEMSAEHKGKCENTYKWMSLVQRCFRREFGALCSESKTFQIERIDQIIDELAAPEKKEDIKLKIVNPCIEEMNSVEGDWLKMHAFDCCMMYRGKDVCKEIDIAWKEFESHSQE